MLYKLYLNKTVIWGGKKSSSPSIKAWLLGGKCWCLGGLCGGTSGVASQGMLAWACNTCEFTKLWPRVINCKTQVHQRMSIVAEELPVERGSALAPCKKQWGNRSVLEWSSGCRPCGQLLTQLGFTQLSCVLSHSIASAILFLRGSISKPCYEAQ